MTATSTAFATLADFARALMDEGYLLIPRDDPDCELARLGRPSKHNPSEVIILYRDGAVVVGGRGRAKAAAVVERLCCLSGGAR